MIKNTFFSVLEISLSIGLAAGAMIILTPLLNRRYAAKWKYCVWIFLALRLIIPYRGTESLGVMLTKAAASTISASGEINADILPAGIAQPQGVVIKLPAQMTAPLALPAGDNRTAGITLLDIAAVIWLIGSLVIVILHISSYLRYIGRLRRRGIPVNDGEIMCKLQSLKEELHIRRKLSVIRYSEAASPMIIGFVRPVLILPEETYCTEELSFILKHELVHLKRGDVYVKLLLMAAKAMHWFNPVIWMMQKEAVVDMELSCDERVVRDTNYTVRKAYTETLFSTLHRACVKKTYFSTQFYGGKQIMKKRFLNILMRPKKRNGLFMLACAAILIVCAETLFSGFVVNGEAGRETILSYIKGFDGKNVTFDAVEWVEVPGERAAELGITEAGEPSGFHVYNETPEFREIPLAQDCVCKILDWSVSEEHIVVTARELLTILDDRKELRDIIPYHLTIQDGEIIEITEQYIP